MEKKKQPKTVTMNVEAPEFKDKVNFKIQDYFLFVPNRIQSQGLKKDKDEDAIEEEESSQFYRLTQHLFTGVSGFILVFINI